MLHQHPERERILFTPGRGSELREINGQQRLVASRATWNRVLMAIGQSRLCHYARIIFAGGFPGVAEKWQSKPPAGQSEAAIMGRIFRAHLASDKTSINSTDDVYTQGESDNSIGDVRLAFASGILNLDMFSGSDGADLDIVCGALHYQRFKAIFHAIGVPSSSIHRVSGVRDPYERPATAQAGHEHAFVGIAKELGAILVTRLVLWNVEPGNLDSLQEAEKRFIDITSRIPTGQSQAA